MERLRAADDGVALALKRWTACGSTPTIPVFPDGLTAIVRDGASAVGHYCFAAVFLGLAEAGLQRAGRAERTQGAATTAVSDLARLPGIQFAVARMRGRRSRRWTPCSQYATRHVDPGEDLPAFVAEHLHRSTTSPAL
ncbi:hypothetical protein [Streptomyces sp. KL116D]|uniref:hypothetical protein n=1 Tax=Streptomyces sp. KL116D TaxID=3045152 RepID=UPI0035561DB8